MRLFFQTLLMMALLVSVGALGYYIYLNRGIHNKQQVSLQVPEQTSDEVPVEQPVQPEGTVTQEPFETQVPQDTVLTEPPAGPPAPGPLVFEKAGVLSLPAQIAHHDWTKNLPVVIVVDKSDTQTHVLQMFDGDSVYEVYTADNAIGDDDTPSPPGPYVVASKTLQPSWTPTKSIDKQQKTIEPFEKDKHNPLGVAAIRLNKWNIVLHGTNNPRSIGKEASHGCIRHRNDDIMRIYDAVWKGTPVIVADKLAGTKVSKDMFLPVKNKS